MALAEAALAAALAFWSLLPAHAANPLAVVFGGGTPMDFGRSLRDGKRILGDGKTWRGFVGGAASGFVLGLVCFRIWLSILVAACFVGGSLTFYGVKIVSIGFFVPKGEATIWRGPLLSKVIDKFLGGVEWGELDYLLVDLPPGTGDVQLSLCQKIPLTGAAVVSTPQDLAFNVAEKAIFMFTKLRTPVLGLVENMSGFECRHCGHREEIFGSGGARRFAAASGIPFLGEIPLSTDIRTTSDEGNPIVQSMPESPSARAFLRVAENLAAQVSTLTLGGVSTDRPEIAEMTQPSENEVQILWKDGHESIYTDYALRVGCRCAMCVDEISGNKRLREESISKDVRPLSIDPVGRYAIRFQWSDGHSTGIYTFEHLRELCPCQICADNAEARAR